MAIIILSIADFQRHRGGTFSFSIMIHFAFDVAGICQCHIKPQVQIFFCLCFFVEVQIFYLFIYLIVYYFFISVSIHVYIYMLSLYVYALIIKVLLHLLHLTVSLYFLLLQALEDWILEWQLHSLLMESK